MNLADAPRSVVDRIRGRRRTPPDDPLVRRLSETAGRLQPDPLFVRRVRGETVNHYLGAREARAGGRWRERKEMGRLGRAVLYASFALTLSATAAGAAAQQALPGDALYGVKLRLEELRLQIAPASLRPQLAALGLELRLEEVEALAGRGDWARAGRAAQLVDRAAAQVAAYGLTADGPGALRLEHHTDALTQLIAEAPEAARVGLQRAIEASAAAAGPTGTGAGQSTAHGTGTTGGGTNAGGQSADHTPKPHPSPAASPHAEH